MRATIEAAFATNEVVRDTFRSLMMDNISGRADGVHNGLGFC